MTTPRLFSARLMGTFGGSGVHPIAVVVLPLIISALVIAGVVAGAPAAWAHIDPDPTSAPAGSRISVGLTVEHGCDGSPTVVLAVRMPAGSGEPEPEPPAGWTGSVDGDVVRFAGGVLPDPVQETFRVTVTLPLLPGETVYFPMVQTCEVGELRWIDIPADGSGTELDEPAPAMKLTEALPGADTTVQPTPTDSPVVTSSAPTLPSEPTVPASTAVATSPPEPTPSTTGHDSSPEVAPEPVEPGLQDGSDGGGAAILLIVGGALIAAAVAAAVWRSRLRRP